MKTYNSFSEREAVSHFLSHSFPEEFLFFITSFSWDSLTADTSFSFLLGFLREEPFHFTYRYDSQLFSVYWSFLSQFRCYLVSDSTSLSSMPSSFLEFSSSSFIFFTFASLLFWAMVNISLLFLLFAFLHCYIFLDFPLLRYSSEDCFFSSHIFSVFLQTALTEA